MHNQATIHMMTPDNKSSGSVTNSAPNRARAVSHSDQKLSSGNESSSVDTKRYHSASVSSVSSQMTSDSLSHSNRKSYDYDVIDLEKQLYISAGGNNANVCCFLLKMTLLTAAVLGCGVLVFYAL